MYFKTFGNKKVFSKNFRPSKKSIEKFSPQEIRKLKLFFRFANRILIFAVFFAIWDVDQTRDAKWTKVDTLCGVDWTSGVWHNLNLINLESNEVWEKIQKHAIYQWWIIYLVRDPWVFFAKRFLDHNITLLISSKPSSIQPYEIWTDSMIFLSWIFRKFEWFGRVITPSHVVHNQPIWRFSVKIPLL